MSATWAGLVVTNLEYIEEATEGTFPTNPAMVFLAQTAKWTPDLEMDITDFRRLGSEDPFKILQGKQIYKSTLEFAIANSTFIKYGIAAAGGGAGSIDKALSIGMSIKIAGVENFIKMTRSRINSLKITASPAKPEILCTAEILHDDTTTPSTTDYKGIGTHATADATAPWTYVDGGADPITWGSALPVEEITLNFARNVMMKYVMGAAKAKYSLPTKRGITGDLSTIWLNTSQEADLKANTVRNLVWVLKSAVSTLTITSASLHKLGREKDANATDIIMEKYGLTALSASIT